MTLAGMAIINAAYLSYKAYVFQYVSKVDFSTICSFSSTNSCSNVLASPYSLVFGIPFPWIALIVYPILFFLALRGFQKSSYAQAKTIAILSGLGMCFNGFIIYREITIIHAYCVLCLICTAIIISIFAISLSILREAKNVQRQ
jgi:uncharacterized membrane protein